MKCALCGVDFNAEYSEKSCENCSIFGSCDLVKCPFCGYENIPQKNLKKNKTHNKNQKKKVTLKL